MEKNSNENVEKPINVYSSEPCLPTNVTVVSPPNQSIKPHDFKNVTRICESLNSFHIDERPP